MEYLDDTWYSSTIDILCILGSEKKNNFRKEDSELDSRNTRVYTLQLIIWRHHYPKF
jgi:hypothetical protein